jgi:hypothetical protein
MLANVMRETSPAIPWVTRLDRFARSTRDLLNLSTSSGSKVSAVAGASVANQFVHTECAPRREVAFCRNLFDNAAICCLAGHAIGGGCSFMSLSSSLRSPRRTSSAHLIGALILAIVALTSAPDARAPCRR